MIMVVACGQVGTQPSGALIRISLEFSDRGGGGPSNLWVQ